MATEKLTMKDLLRTASSDKRVAAALLTKPEEFAPLYNLSEAQVKGLKEISTRMSAGMMKSAIKDINYE